MFHAAHNHAQNLRRTFMNFPKLLVPAIISLFGLAPSSLFAQNGWAIPDFSATQVFQSRRADLSMKVYRYGSNVRVERSGAMSTLYVTAKAKIYNLTTYPDQTHQCVSMNPGQARMLPSPLELIQGKVVKRIPGGSEMVEGHKTKIETVLVVRPDGKKIQSKVWEARDLNGIPVKIESHVGKTTLTALYRNIKIGSQDHSLFTVPERCTPFENMGQVAEMRVLK
jgi:hypothetical protein